MIIRTACLRRLFFGRKYSRSAKETWETLFHDNRDISFKRFLEEHSDTVNTILKNTEITRKHLTPELKLFLLTENCPLYHEPFIDKSENEGSFDPWTRNTFRDPFWSIYWPGGQALTRFVLDEREVILGCKTPDAENSALRILDLGAGCGATAIAAKLTLEKCKIIANDINKVACVAIAMNAILNNVEIEVSWKNLLERTPEEPYDVIFVGDLLYDEEIANILIKWLEYAHVRGARIYLGDPGRHGLTEDLRKRLRSLRKYPLPESVRKENHGYDTAIVWEFKRT